MFSFYFSFFSVLKRSVCNDLELTVFFITDLYQFRGSRGSEEEKGKGVG